MEHFNCIKLIPPIRLASIDSIRILTPVAPFAPFAPFTHDSRPSRRRHCCSCSICWCTPWVFQSGSPAHRRPPSNRHWICPCPHPCPYPLHPSIPCHPWRQLPIVRPGGIRPPPAAAAAGRWGSAAPHPCIISCPPSATGGDARALSSWGSSPSRRSSPAGRSVGWSAGCRCPEAGGDPSTNCRTDRAACCGTPPGSRG